MQDEGRRINKRIADVFSYDAHLDSLARTFMIQVKQSVHKSAFFRIRQCRVHHNQKVQITFLRLIALHHCRSMQINARKTILQDLLCNFNKPANQQILLIMLVQSQDRNSLIAVPFSGFFESK